MNWTLVKTVGLLVASNVFMTFAWYAHLRDMKAKPWFIAALVIVQGGTLWALWARLLQWRPLRTRYENSARWIDGAFGIALAVLALTLLLSP